MDLNFITKLLISSPILSQVEQIVAGIKGKKTGLKGFCKGKEIDKSSSIFSLKNINENDVLYFNAGRSVATIYRRFPSTSAP